MHGQGHLPCPSCGGRLWWHPNETNSLRCESCQIEASYRRKCTKLRPDGKRCHRIASFFLDQDVSACDRCAADEDRVKAIVLIPGRQLGTVNARHRLGGNQGVRVIRKGEFPGQHVGNQAPRKPID